MRLTVEQKKEKTTRLYNVLLSIKEKCDNGDFRNNNENINSFFYENGFKNTAYLTAMNNLKILYKDDFMCNRWKENIPVTVRLTNTIIKKASELNSTQRRTNSKTHQGNIHENKKTTTKKVNNTQTILSYNIPKVGLIRRFLRWLY